MQGALRVRSARIDAALPLFAAASPAVRPALHARLWGGAVGLGRGPPRPVPCASNAEHPQSLPLRSTSNVLLFGSVLLTELVDVSTLFSRDPLLSSCVKKDLSTIQTPSARPLGSLYVYSDLHLGSKPTGAIHIASCI
jgi:hypothetical protein